MVVNFTAVFAVTVGVLAAIVGVVIALVLAGMAQVRWYITHIRIIERGRPYTKHSLWKRTMRALPHIASCATAVLIFAPLHHYLPNT